MATLAVCLALMGLSTTANELIVLENDLCRLEMDPQHGRCVRLLDKVKGVDLQSSAEAAENFRLLVPMPDAPENYVLGHQQTVTASEATDQRLVLHWAGPMTDQAGRLHDISARLTAEWTGAALVFRFHLQNRSPHTVREVWYPGLGGLLDFGPPETSDQTTLHSPPNARKLRSPFGQYTVGYPLHNLPFVSLDNPTIGRGLYFGAHDSVARFKAIHLVESTSADQRNALAYLVHFPSTPPGGTFEGSPVVVQFHDGDWIEAGRSIYRPWFIKTFGIATPENDWIRRHGFYQMIMVMLPEGNINYTFKQIPQLARDGLKYGVKSLQIAGWQRGGHDNGYPYYEPDPRLGTWKELADALRQCHELGVRVYFFVNIHVNNLDTEWYLRELKDIDYQNRQGYRYMVAGWGMGTLASRIGHTAPLMTTGDVTYPGLRDRLLDYFKRLTEAGADGIHVDKCYPGLLNFNPRATLSPDSSPWEGTVSLLESIRRECRAIRPDFAISIETTWDRSLQFGASTWWGGNMTAAKQIFPELVETVGLYQPYDFAGVNSAVRNGYAVMIAPYHFNRSMDTEAWRGLAEYIREVKQIRDELADSIYFGEFLGPAKVQFGQTTPAAPPNYATFRNRENGKLACVLTQHHPKTQTLSLVALGDETRATVRVYRPFRQPEMLQLPATIILEPEDLAVVVQP